MLAYDYPLLDVFVTMVFLVLFMVWVILIIHVLGDLFRAPDMGGVAKAGWIVLLIVLPYIGVLAYIVAHGHEMGARELERAQAKEQALESYVRQTAGGSGTADELTKLADLRDRGVLTDDEFAKRKATLLA